MKHWRGQVLKCEFLKPVTTNMLTFQDLTPCALTAAEVIERNQAAVKK